MAEKLKVLILNGSPRTEGNTTIAIHEMEHVFEENGVEYETIQVGKMDIRGCAACGTCYKNGKCMFDDIVNELAPKFEAADGMVIASPVFYASANATLIACLDRLFYSTKFDKTMKVGAMSSAFQYLDYTLKQKILTLYNENSDIVDEIVSKYSLPSVNENSIASFVKLRNNKTHSGTVEWGESAKIYTPLFAIVYASFFKYIKLPDEVIKSTLLQIF